MDDLYDNLENYHDEKILDELKNENKNLKAKLEEYSSAMTRLQMDFDKLNSEYKNLEMNYSSLLKTARAEIERKSEMIKSLNTEKDLLIIKSLQTSGKNILYTRRHFYDLQRLKESHEIDTKCGGKSGPQSSYQNEEKRHRNDDRINSTQTQSENTIPDLENKSNFSEDKELRDSHIGNKTDKSKENLRNNIHKDDPVERKVEKISKRRKSMPYGRNMELIFSSDDDFEALNLKNIRKSPLREDLRYFDKRSNENCSSKDRFYNNKTNRYITRGKQSHDRYKYGSKYTRHSPEKYRSKYTNQHSETYRSRVDYKNSRQRVPSPPTDKYNRSKSRDRKTFERESCYDNQEQGHSAHMQNNSAVKYKSKNALDEPSSKRQKTEQNKGSIELNDREREHSLRGSLTKQDFMEPTSCQSPDYVNIENSIPQHVVKEIKHTAATPLEDPRISSKKYVIKNNKDKTVLVLATVNSADVDLKPITVSAWNIPEIEKFMIHQRLPTEQLPAKTDNDFVNGINMDIDSSLLKDSLESREIHLDYDNYYTKDSGVDKLDENKKSKEDHNKTNSNTLTDIDSDNIRNNNKYKIPKIKKPDKIFTAEKHEDFEDNGVDKLDENKKSKEDHNKTTNTLTDIDSDNMKNNNKYKIPKIKKPDKILTAEKHEDFEDNGVDKLDENKKSKEEHNKTSNTLTDIDSDNMKNNNKYKIPKIKKPDKILTAVKHEDFGLSSKTQNPAKKHGNENIELEIENCGDVSTSLRATPNTNNEMMKISTVLPEKKFACTLAEDLELSDEATEIRDIHNDARKSTKIFPKSKPSMDSVDLNKQKQYVNSINDEIINSEKSKPFTQIKKTSKDSSKDSGKIRKSKKKTELKDTTCTETKELKELQIDTKINSKPVISIETKNKFSDLFGDSSSLITPDDLGLPHPESQLPLTDKYVSIYDNTQDAVDLSVADINGKQCNASKLSTFATLREDQSNEKTVIGKERSDTEKSQVYKDCVENTNVNSLPEKNSYEKAALNESEILKTVIISTGIQPKYTSESIQAQDSQKSDIEHTDKIHNVKTNMKTCMLNNIKALATSTPQKPEHVDISTPITDPGPNGAVDAITNNTNLSYNVSNASNPDEILNEADVPDLRIFVRRRRKIIKKP